MTAFSGTTCSLREPTLGATALFSTASDSPASADDPAILHGGHLLPYERAAHKFAALSYVQTTEQVMGALVCSRGRGQGNPRVRAVGTGRKCSSSPDLRVNACRFRIAVSVTPTTLCCTPGSLFNDPAPCASGGSVCLSLPLLFSVIRTAYGAG